MSKSRNNRSASTTAVAARMQEHAARQGAEAKRIAGVNRGLANGCRIVSESEGRAFAEAKFAALNEKNRKAA
jgi:hypothetical protein